jgi:hypothetical protein
VTLERFLALAPKGDRSVYVKQNDERSELCTRTGYRTFAAWYPAGDQPGLHVRGFSGVASTQFRGKDSNWIYVADADWNAVPALVEAARKIAAMRGGGRKSVELELYQPLEKAMKLVSQKPARMHAGGPRAKILSGELEVASGICLACADRMKEPAPAVAKRCAALAKQARNAGAMSCKSFATEALVLALTELEATDPVQASAFARAIDERILGHEFSAAFAKFAKGDPPTVERVLWRGADAKGFPGFWFVRLGRGEYGLLAKLGGRWGWHVADRDSTFATVPDALLDAATEMVIARDVPVTDELIPAAEQRLSWLFGDLQDFTTVSAWVGPDFDYDLPYHDLLDVAGLDPARSARLRRRGLVAMLLACLGVLEEHWSMGLASDHERCVARLAALAPADSDEVRLIAIVRQAFAIVARGGVDDAMDAFALDREMRWVHERFVRGALDASDATIGPRPPDAMRPGLRALAREVARKTGE